MDSKTIPKVEIHCHLDACFRLPTVKEIEQTLGLIGIVQKTLSLEDAGYTTDFRAQTSTASKMTLPRAAFCRWRKNRRSGTGKSGSCLRRQCIQLDSGAGVL